MPKPGAPALLPDLSAKIIVVTGANSGLGYETTLALAGAGATVILGCRDVARAAEAAAAIRAQHPAARLEVEALDLASLASVAAFADAIAQRHQRLDVLCNNAGVMALPRRLTADGFEMQFGTNHLGHFALTGRLLPLLLRAERARVVTVSSLYHRGGRVRFDDLTWERGYRKWAAYSMSKLANLLFTYELQRRIDAAGRDLMSVAAHPGYAATNLQQAAPRMTGSAAANAFYGFANALFAQSAARGALPQIHACTAPEVRGGDFFGPRGPLELWGAPRRVSSSAESHREDAADRLFSVSEALTGVKYALAASE